MGKWQPSHDWDSIGKQAANVDTTPRIIHPAIPGKVLHIRSWVISCQAQADITIEDTDGNDIIGPLYFGERGGHDKGECKLGELRAPIGKGIRAVSTSVTVSTVYISIYRPRNPTDDDA